HVARGAQQQATATHEAASVSSSIEQEMRAIATVTVAAASAGAMAQTATQRGAESIGQAADAMAQLQTIMRDADRHMQELRAVGRRIGDIVAIIDDIAEQTNLLALNAAIEAARAGDQGRGFAVVADEVRKLADRSSRETQQIAELVHAVQEGAQRATAVMAQGVADAERGHAVVTQASARFHEVEQHVMTLSQHVSSIATAAKAVQTATETAATNVQSIAAIAEENTSAVEQVSGGVEELVAQIAQATEEARALATMAESLAQLAVEFTTEAAAESTPVAAPTRLVSRRARAA
ncbi:MAG: methyl-accepting chemotaxis protein, partial [Dehalococcoidia bacterium]|nr:methyl-accepting chemotaxis protein [Dehalococcoidia bacterium]